MNKNQWNVLAFGSFAIGMYLIIMANTISCSALMSTDLFTACYVRRYAYAIPALICMALFFIFSGVGIFEKK